MGQGGCTKELLVPGQQTFDCGQLWTDPAYNVWIGGRSLTTFYHEILERKYQLPMDGGNIYGHCGLRPIGVLEDGVVMRDHGILLLELGLHQKEYITTKF